MTTTSSASSGTYAGFARVADEIRDLRGKLDKVRRLAGFLKSLPDEAATLDDVRAAHAKYRSVYT